MVLSLGLYFLRAVFARYSILTIRRLSRVVIEDDLSQVSLIITRHITSSTAYFDDSRLPLSEETIQIRHD